MDDGKLSEALNKSAVTTQKKSFTMPHEALKLQATTL